jgi:hypothetical protein
VVVVSGQKQRLSNRRNRRFRELVATLPAIGECVHCSGPLQAWWTLYDGQKSQRSCYECNLAKRRASRKHRERTPQYIPAVVLCVACLTPFQRGKYNKKYCSETCKESGRRDVERAQRNRRRGAATGIPYTLREVYDRDGGVCHLCRKKVDLRLSGNDPKGPTIDHLVPISSNGIDCFTNVALAHWSCNIKRGATGPAQLRLVG